MDQVVSEKTLMRFFRFLPVPSLMFQCPEKNLNPLNRNICSKCDFNPIFLACRVRIWISQKNRNRNTYYISRERHVIQFANKHTRLNFWLIVSRISRETCHWNIHAQKSIHPVFSHASIYVFQIIKDTFLLPFNIQLFKATVGLFSAVQTAMFEAFVSFSLLSNVSVSFAKLLTQFQKYAFLCVLTDAESENKNVRLPLNMAKLN